MLQTLALWAFAAQAAPPIGASSPTDLRAALMTSFHELTAPMEAGGPDHACLTPLVRQLKENWALFSPAEKAEITATLAPWASDLSAAVHPRTAAPTSSMASTPCFGLSGSYDVLTDPNGRFYVAWESGSIDEDTAQDLLDALTQGYETEIDDLDWREPAGMNKYPLLVYVYDAPSTAAAYTTVDYCSGVGYMPYIVVGSGSFYGGTWYQDMAVHEFNHASQYAYTDTRGSINQNIDLWWWEATATWTQEYVYPNNNWWSQYISGYTNSPYLAMETSNQSNNTDFWHMYGMSIWAFYLDEHEGGFDMVQGTWEYAASSSSRSLGVDELIEGVGGDWDEVYEGFIANNVVMDFDERRYFGSIKATEEVSELPASGEPSRKTPEGWGQNYITIDKDAASAGTHAQISFNGDDDVDWYALVVTAYRNKVTDTVVMELDDHQKGTAEIVFDGDSEFALVVSPNSSRQTGRDYSWSIEEVEATEPDPAEDSGDSGGSDEGVDPPDSKDGDAAFNPDDDKTGGVCGCSMSGAPGGLALGGLLALAALSRRRRT